jgi:tetratricopeptide (TPR) repeat protein
MGLESDGGDRLGGPVAILIALATLLAAICGFQQADTTALADDQRLEATRLGLEAAASAQRGQQDAQVEYQVYLRAIEQQTHSANATLRGLFAETDSAAARRFDLERERWQRLADLTLAATEIQPDAEFGPQRDATFPTRYFARAAQESHRLNALQDAYNEQSNLLDQRAASYTAILAVLAVSVYLLGLTLAVREHLLRRLFLGIGLLLMSGAALWIVLAAAQPVAAIRDEAAVAYAAARVELDTAYDNAGYDEARGLYDQAIELRPTFARAYLDRAMATILAATPQRTGLVSLVPPDALRAGQDDLRRALALGATTASTFGRLGFYDFLEGVQTRDARALADSVASTRRAIELDPGEPVWRLNLGVALVALERFDEAAAAYRDGVERVIFIDGDPQRRRDEVWQEQLWLAGALTDLEVVGRHRPELVERVRGFKEWLVGRIAAGTLDEPATSSVSVDGLALDVYASKVQWQATLAGYDAARDVVSVQWYRAAPDSDEWAVVPELSNSGAPFLAADGRHGVQTFYLGAFNPPTCLSVGTYRAEVYVNGRLLATEQVTPVFGELTAAAPRDITVALCRPADWQPIEDPLPGLVQGFTGAAGDRGIYVMRLAMPRSFMDADELTTLIIDTALTSFADRFPGTPTYLESDGTTDHDFIALERTAWRWYDYETGYVRVAAGLTDDGAAVLAMLYGPYDWFDTDEPYDVINSMVSYE